MTRKRFRKLLRAKFTEMNMCHIAQTGKPLDMIGRAYRVCAPRFPSTLTPHVHSYQQLSDMMNLEGKK